MSAKDTWTYSDQALLIGYLTLGEDFPSVAHLIGKSEAQIRDCWTKVSDLLAPDVPPVSLPMTEAPRQPRKRPQPAPVSAEAEDQTPPQKSPLKKWEPRKFRVSPFARSLAQHGQRDVTATLMGDPSAAQLERSLATLAKPRPSSHHTKWS
ncbi:MAG: hypothetical protein ABJQ71_15245 [Roseibium sp.]